MDEAVSSSVGPFVPSEKKPVCECESTCTSGVFRSFKDLLCDALFGKMPLGMNGTRQIPNIGLWKEGVEMEGNEADNTAPYTFDIETEEGVDPRKSDVIFYNGRFYVIGDVHTAVDPYLEIDPEIIWVFPDWAVDNDVLSNTRWNVK